MSLAVTPTLIEGDVARAKKKIERLRGLGAGVHLDVVDGLFADNITVDPSDFTALDFAGIRLDIHLMVDDPAEWVESCVLLGCDRLFAQIERMGSQVNFVTLVKGFDIKVGLAIDIKTPVESLEEIALSGTDAVLLMSYPAGEGGGVFDEKVLDKIMRVRKVYGGSLVVDGGINLLTVSKVEAKGASEVAVGSYLWQGDIKKRMEVLRK